MNTRANVPALHARSLPRTFKRSTLIGQLIRCKVSLPAKSELGIIWNKLLMATDAVAIDTAAVGDSSRDVIGNLKRTTKAILRMATAEDVEDSEQNSVDDLTRLAVPSYPLSLFMYDISAVKGISFFLSGFS